MSELKNTIRCGMVVRADITGLGNQSQDWVMQLPIAKTLVVWTPYKEAFPQIYGKLDSRICEAGFPSVGDIEWLLKDIDVLICLETPYNWNLISEAKKKGVKTIINPNYEWLPRDIPEQPDLWLCTNRLNYDFIETENKVYIPQPINREVFQFKKRKKARVFLFNNGNGGAHGRNGLKEFLEAINFVKSDVKFIIHSQIPIETIYDKRIELHEGEPNIQEIWKEGDVFVHLRKFGAMSLPMNEAMSLGMPIIGINRNPENTYLPTELLIEPEGKYPMRCREDVIEIEACSYSSKKIAEKIDEIANTDISAYSEKMNELADKWDWEKLRNLYIENFYNIVNNLPPKNYEEGNVDIRATEN